MRFLIVVKSEKFARTLRDVLTDRYPDAPVEEASQAADALRVVETFDPDLVFVDVRLSDGNGFDICARMRAISPASCLILLTNSDIPEYLDAARRSGADYLFSKNSCAWDDIDRIIKRRLRSMEAGASVAALESP